MMPPADKPERCLVAIRRATCPLTFALILALLMTGAAPVPARAEERRAPAPGARAALVMDATTGAILYEREAHVERAPASLTKMVTAMVAVERAPLDRMVRTTHPYDVVPVVIGLEPGDSLTLEQALYGLLLNSGNDAAVAIAEAVGDGSSDRFVGWMNELAERLGLENSHFKNPHGLDQEGHVSSAYDMAIIGRAVMRQPVLARIVGQGRFVVDGPPRWVFRSGNPLLGVYQGVDGIKTGFDDNAGRCLVATAQRGERRAIAVVLNSQNTADDAASLLDYAFGDADWGPRVVTFESPAAPSGTPLIPMLRADLSAPGDGIPTTIARAHQVSIVQKGANFP
jgi:D-alanyl-D-alanine carboxypeptidase (penicillin-binding protein 5/6)